MDNLILVAAYPRSGSTWLTRLLGELLNSTTAGSIDAEEDIVNESRPGAYFIRRGHYVLVDNEGGPLIPASHQLAWKRLASEHIVFLVRDPRDICVSGAFRWQTTPEQFLTQMIIGDVAGCGRWDEYCGKWWKLEYLDMEIVKYRHLLSNPITRISTLFEYLKLPDLSSRAIKEALNRQSFAARAAQTGDNEQELSRNNMRKGIVGDWRNYFTDAMNERILNEFGWMMGKLGYE